MKTITVPNELHRELVDIKYSGGFSTMAEAIGSLIRSPASPTPEKAPPKKPPESRSIEPKEPEKNSTDLDDKPLLREKSGPAYEARVRSLDKGIYGQKQGKRGKK